MKKFFNCLRKYTTVIAVWAALVSAITTFSMYEYTKKINKSAISLDFVNIREKVISENSLDLIFFFVLHATGNEPINITNISTSYFDYEDNLFKYIDENSSLLNTLYPEACFQQRAIIPMRDMRELGKKKTNAWFDLAIMIRIDYQTQSGAYHVVYYMKYNDLLEAHYLSRKEYDIMESHLPDEFRLNL